MSKDFTHIYNSPVGKLTLAIRGSEFRKQVLRILLKIPYGKRKRAVKEKCFCIPE